MITLHGLLFTAYGFSLGAQATWLMTIVNANTNGHTAADVPLALMAPKFAAMKRVIDTVRAGIAIVGIGSAALAAFGVTAANRAIRNDVAAYRQFLTREKITESVPWRDRPIGFAGTHLLGMATGLGFPVLVAWVWMYIAGWLSWLHCASLGLVAATLLLWTVWPHCPEAESSAGETSPPAGAAPPSTTPSASPVGVMAPPSGASASTASTPPPGSAP